MSGRNAARRDRSRVWRQLCALAVAAVLSMGSGRAVAEPAGFIHADGTRLVDGQGADFAVKGINLGNWLVPEGYMFKFKRALSPTEIAAVIEKLVGPAAADRFWTQFRDVYVGKDDIDFLKAAGFNTVRVPLNWRLFVEPGAQAGDERHRLPVAVRHLRDEALATRTAPVVANHFRRDGRLVDEHETSRLERRLLGFQLRARRGHVRSILLGSVQSFF